MEKNVIIAGLPLLALFFPLCAACVAGPRGSSPQADNSFGWTQDIIDTYTAISAMYYPGDNSRLAEFVEKLQDGKNVTVGFIGGSITQGAPGPGANFLYPKVFCDWLRVQFPQSTVEMINIGVGATNSFYGVHRIEGEMLYRDPDLVIVEFSANDPSNDLYDESYESLCRKILNWRSRPALVLLSMCWKNFGTAQNIHDLTAEYYDIPMVSYHDAVRAGLENGDFTWEMLSNDDVHPNRSGHWFTAQLLVKRLETVIKTIDSIKKQDNALPVARTANRYEDASMIWSRQTGIVPMPVPVSLGGFEALPYSDFFNWNKGWSCSTPGSEPLIFEITAGYIAVAYLDFEAQFSVVVDKGTSGEKIFVVDRRIDGGTTNVLRDVVNDGIIQKHTIEIRHADNSGQVYIGGIMVSQQKLF